MSFYKERLEGVFARLIRRLALRWWLRTIGEEAFHALRGDSVKMAEDIVSQSAGIWVFSPFFYGLWRGRHTFRSANATGAKTDGLSL